MMETRENDLAHSLLMEIRVFAKLCIFFCECRRFLPACECFCSGKRHVETPEERRKWGES